RRRQVSLPPQQPPELYAACRVSCPRDCTPWRLDHETRGNRPRLTRPDMLRSWAIVRMLHQHESVDLVRPNDLHCEYRMTLMLASVAGAEEAEAAVTLGADLVDLKDAARGALGALAPDVVRAAVRTIAGRRPASAVTGDLPMEPDTLVAAAAAMAETGVQFVKVGLFPDARRDDCIASLATLARGTKLVGVMFADLESDDGARCALIETMRTAGFAGAMLDT